MFRKSLPSGASLALASIALIVPAGPAGARDRLEVRTDVGVSEVYDSNVRSAGRDEESDMLTLITPRVDISHRGDRDTSTLSFGLASRDFRDNDSFDSLSRHASFDSEYRLSPRLRLLAGGLYRFLENTEDPQPDLEGGIVSGRPDLTVLNTSAGARYSLTPTLSAGFRASWADRSFDDEGPQATSSRTDSTSTSLGFDLSRTLTARDSVALQFRETLSEFQRNDPRRGDSESETSSLSLLWSRAWNPRWTSSVSVGGRYLRSEDAQGLQVQPINPGDLPSTSPDDRNFSLTGSVSISRESKRSSLSLSYSRQTRPSSGFGTDLDVDSAVASLRVQLSRRWGAFVRGAWTQQTSAGDSLVFADPLALIPVPPDAVFVLCPDTFIGTTSLICARVTDTAVDTETRNLSAGLSWRLTKRLRGVARFTWRDQESSGDTTIGSFDKYLVTVGLSYAYDFDLY